MKHSWLRCRPLYHVAMHEDHLLDLVALNENSSAIVISVDNRQACAHGPGQCQSTTASK